MNNGKGDNPRPFSNYRDYAKNHDKINWRSKKRLLSSFSEVEFNKLKKSGMLWEFYPDAPEFYKDIDEC